MEWYSIPFGDKFIIYRPLPGLAFIGNAALVDYIKAREQSSPDITPDEKIDDFLELADFWAPDPPGPPAWIPAETHQPTMAVLMMTTACNLRCTYCYARGGEGPRVDMNIDLAKAVIDRVHANALARGQSHYSLVFHGGGEPVVNWKVLTRAAEYARSQELPCQISMASNGVWTAAQRRFIIENVSSVSLSFDGLPAIQNTQRPRADGKASFPALMRTIRDLEAAKSPYGIRMTVTPESVEYLPANIDFICEHTTCQSIQAEPAYASVRGEYADPSPEQAEAFAQAFFEAYNRAQARGRYLFYSGSRPGTISGCFCQAPESALIVTPEGDIVTCFEIHDRRHALIDQFVIGHAAPEKIEVDMEKLRAFARGQSERRDKCEGCFCYWHCGGDCASRCMASPETDRWRCQVNRTITRELIAWNIAAGDGIWRAHR